MNDYGDPIQGLTREQLAQKAQSLTAIAPAPTNPSAQQPVVLQPTQATGAQNLTIPQPTNSMVQADATVAGAGQTTKGLDSYIQELTPKETSLDKQNKSLSDSLHSLYGLDTGKAKATLEEEGKAGLPDLKKRYADLNSQILTKTAEYEKMFSSLDTQSGVTTAVATAQQNGLRRSQAADIGLLQARALGLQGQMNAAQDAVERAINLKYQGIEEEITAKERQMKLIEPMLTREQQKVANAQQLKLQDERERIVEEKSKAKINLTLAIESGVKTRFANKNGEFFEANSGVAFPDTVSFLKAAGVSTFAEAYQRGLVTDITPPVAEIDTQVITANGRSLLINTQTGETIRDLGGAYKAGSSGGGGGSSLSYSSASKTGLKPSADTASEIKAWILANKRANPSIPYFDLWGQLSDELNNQGLNASNFDAQFWEVLHPDGLTGYKKQNKQTTSSPETISNPFK